MRLTMKEKRSVIQVMQERYKKARKKLKQQILDECCELTGYNRSYVSHVLCHGQPARVRKKPKARATRARKDCYYDEKVQQALRQIWLLMDCICGKRLQPMLAELVAILEKFGEIKISARTRQKLGEISSATMDRLLARTRQEMGPHARSHTKPGTLLKSQIPIRTFAEWNEAQPGFVEIDLVAHDGGQASGEYLYTLDVTDVCTGWTETRAVRNKGQVAVCDALIAIRQRLPFPLQGIDSDNGSEFINDHLLRYCQREKITFTRARSYRKNDNCFVEQKNNSVVRRNVGYQRYEGEQEDVLLNELYGHLRLYTNYFQPVQKLVSKERDGARVRKKYSVAQTPYRRVLAAGTLDKKKKAQLRREYESLNPAALKRHITRLQNELIDLALRRRQAAEKPLVKQRARVPKTPRRTPSAHHPWRKAWSKNATAEKSKA